MSKVKRFFSDIIKETVELFEDEKPRYVPEPVVEHSFLIPAVFAIGAGLVILYYL